MGTASGGFEAHQVAQEGGLLVPPKDFVVVFGCCCLWVRCKGEAVEDWCPFAFFDELREKPSRPRKHMQRTPHAEDDRSLMLFATLKDFPRSVDLELVDVEPEIRALWFVPNRSRAVPIEDGIDNVYGVADDTGAGAGG